VTFTSSSKTRHSSRCVHQLPLSWESTDRACAHQLLEGLCILNQSPAAPALLASTPLLGFSKDCPFIDISQRASTPGGLWLDANILPFATFDLGLPPPGSFRPCRSSRLRRFSPLVRRRLVSSCSRSWGSLRFRFLLSRMPWSPPGLLQPSSSSSFECVSAFPQCATRAYQSRATLRRLSLQRSRAWSDSPEAMEAAASSPSASAVLPVLPLACAIGPPVVPAPFTARILSRRARSPRWSCPGPSPLVVAASAASVLHCWFASAALSSLPRFRVASWTGAARPQGLDPRWSPSRRSLFPSASVRSSHGLSFSSSFMTPAMIPGLSTWWRWHLPSLFRGSGGATSAQSLRCPVTRP